MEREETVNAVTVNPRHVGRFLEFDTVITDTMQAAGLGELGAPVTVRGMLINVENGNTCGRAWSRLTVRPTNPTADDPIVSVLGAHKDVRLFAED